MGTQASLHLRGRRIDSDAGVEPAVAAVFGHLRAADELFSTYRPGSQVSALRRGELPRGTAARGPQVVDPHTGTDPGGLQAVTVTGPTLLWADVFATAAFARGGEDVAEWVATRAPGYEVAALARAP
ncbi:FAD:protein FMN transferase [Amycolatopsis sp. CM201R]|nr:FAD:protein FMN transferase [Amycolatopsis sp. 505]MDS0147420.1 FAD:protein FMN transferase [Amycolatopsis sp. CM201R]